MKFTSNNRGQTQAIGLILLIAITIVFSTIFIGSVVPTEQQSQEQSHYNHIVDELQKTQDKVNLAVGSETTQTVTVDTSIDYRTLWFTPIPIFTDPIQPQLTISTPSQTTYSVLSDSETKSITTDTIEFQPKYFRITPDSLYYENQLLYKNNDDSTPYQFSDQQVITNTNINMYEVTGVDETTDSFTITKTNTESITPLNTNTESVTVRIDQTTITAEEWRTILEDEFVENGGHISTITQNDSNTVIIELESGVEYTYNEYQVDFSS
jgi:preprotein translocase subunit YajC